MGHNLNFHTPESHLCLFLRTVKNAVESGRSFVCVVPVGGVGYRLTNGPVEMLQMSE